VAKDFNLMIYSRSYGVDDVNFEKFDLFILFILNFILIDLKIKERIQDKGQPHDN
jgi:hypothetical protein